MKLTVFAILLLFSALCLPTVCGATTDNGFIVTWESNNSLFIDISGSQRINVTIVDIGVSSTAYLTAESGNSKLAITPLGLTAIQVGLGIPKEFYFGATNLGVDEQIKNIPITIKLYTSYTHTLIAERTVYATLLQTLPSPTEQPTITPTPSPSVPEFPITATLVAVLAAVSLLLMIGKRKQSFNH